MTELTSRSISAVQMEFYRRCLSTVRVILLGSGSTSATKPEVSNRVYRGFMVMTRWFSVSAMLWEIPICTRCLPKYGPTLFIGEKFVHQKRFGEPTDSTLPIEEGAYAAAPWRRPQKNYRLRTKSPPTAPSATSMIVVGSGTAPSESPAPEPGTE